MTGYSLEHDKCWRVLCQGGKPKTPRDYTTDAHICRGAVLAKWPDGYSTEISNIDLEVFALKHGDGDGSAFAIVPVAAGDAMKRPAASPAAACEDQPVVKKRPAASPAAAGEDPPVAKKPAGSGSGKDSWQKELVTFQYWKALPIGHPLLLVVG